MFQDIPTKVLHTYRLRVSKEPLREIRRHPEAQRSALVAIFCWERRQEIIDGLVDLLIQVIHKITVTAERRIVKELVQEIRAVRGKHGLLYKLADAALAHPDETVREAVYPVVDQDTLETIVKEYQAKALGTSGVSRRASIIHTKAIIDGWYPSFWRPWSSAPTTNSTDLYSRRWPTLRPCATPNSAFSTSAQSPSLVLCHGNCAPW